MVFRAHRVVIEGSRIHTPRLTLRPWAGPDAEAACAIYGADEVSRWMAPAPDPVPDVTSMTELIARWVSESQSLEPPEGRWAVELRESGELVGGASLLPLPPESEDLEISWQLAPTMWGQGLASEAGHAVAHQAFESDSAIEELFAVVRPRNNRGAATARRVGMEWVGETEKYYGLRLQVYRLRKGDLDDNGPTAAFR